ncbi:MAG: chloride channel protein [Anaerolineae bacterium]
MAVLWSRVEQRLPENSALLVLAVVIGLSTGAAVYVFRRGIELSQTFFREWLGGEVLGPVFGIIGSIAALALAGAIVGWLMGRFVGKERHHGVAGIMESIALSGGRLRYWRIPAKAVASVISIGAGASVGPEDPSVQIGANLGSFVGARLRLSDERVRLLVAAGGASAIAAAFRAPIAGVFFAMEILLNGSFSTGAFGVVVLAAVVSSVFMQGVEGSVTEFGAMTYDLGSIGEIPLYALLGILLAPLAALFIQTVFWMEEKWHHYGARVPRWARTAITGALMGAVGFYLPQVYGTGREAMTSILSAPSAQTFPFVLLIVLGLLKILLTGWSLGGGFVGGLFAETLFVGTMFGAAFGQIIGVFDPANTAGHIGAFAIAGMAGYMAGVVRAPITAILLVFELTNDYRLILPIMLTTVICAYVTERFVPLGIYHLGLKRKGINLDNGRDMDVMSSIPVRAVMVTPVPRIAEQASLSELRDQLRRQRTRSLCVVDASDQLVGIVTLSDLQRAYESSAEPETVSRLRVRDIMTSKVITTQADVSLAAAIRSMGARDIGRLPVLDVSGVPIGMVSRSDILRGYHQALTRKIESEFDEGQAQLYHLTGAHVVTHRIGEGSPIAGKAIQEMDLPEESVIAAVRRGERLIVPNGSTVVQAHDVLTFVTTPEAESDLERLSEGTP